MQIEFDALLKNQTWELVPYDSSKNFIFCKWLYRIKRNADGIVNPFVAKGYTQRPGVNFHSTFSPVIKPTIIRIILSIAVHFNWPLLQLDVNNAFLQANLAKEVYMLQSPSYEDKSLPSHV